MDSRVEVVEHACGMATLQMGEFVSNVSNGIDSYSIREPIGICAGICPFNFPAMVPLWVSLLYFPLLFVVHNFFIEGTPLSLLYPRNTHELRKIITACISSIFCRMFKFWESTICLSCGYVVLNMLAPEI